MLKTEIVCLALFIVALTGISGAAVPYVNITEPVNYTVLNNGSVFLGKVGPGQTFSVTIAANTTNSTGAIFNRGWNELIATDVPSGWVVSNSSLYLPYETVKITAAPYASNGTYEFNLTAINLGNYSKLGAVHFTALINVTPDVFQLGVSPTKISVGPGEPAKIFVTINNTGVSDSPFIISSTGLPAWNLTEPVIALHHTTGVFSYSVYENEPGNYTANLTVTSASSTLVRKSSSVSIEVQASVLNDYEAIGQGALVSPIIYEPVYAIMYLISKLISVV